MAWQAFILVQVQIKVQGENFTYYASQLYLFPVPAQIPFKLSVNKPLWCIHTDRNRTETGTWTGTRTIRENRSLRLSWFRCNVKASTLFHTTHLIPVPVPVWVPVNVNAPLMQYQNAIAVIL